MSRIENAKLSSEAMAEDSSSRYRVHTFRNSFLKKARWAAHGLLRAAGFELELRRSGELKLGLWRKNLSSSGAKTQKIKTKNSTPRRFILVPGFGDSPLSWLYVLSLLKPILKKNYDEVILVDFPGFQGILAHERAFDSMDLLFSKLFDVFDSLKPDTIFGHSLGAWLASRYAAHCGQGERPLGPVPEGSRHRYIGPKTIILANASGVCGSEELKTAWSQRWNEVIAAGDFHPLRPHIFGKEPFWFKYLVPDFGSLKMNEETLKFLRSVTEEHLVEDLAHRIESRVWLLWGENDTLTPTVFSQGWLKFLKRETAVQAVLLKGVGHSPHIESPHLTALVLTQMLDQERSQWLTHPLAERWWVVQGT